MRFNFYSSYQPAGDQPQAINELIKGVNDLQKYQTLLGVTGSGKTYTLAKVIEIVNRPTLVIAHNKTLAAQLYQELKDFFPNNAVNYFVSYYDYYQPEAYIPNTDTYIEKEAQINDEIDKLRIATTTNLLTRNDIIIVASVSSIYNLGSPEEYHKQTLIIKIGEKFELKRILNQLANLQYSRNDLNFQRGCYRLKGENMQIWPAYSDHAVAIEVFNDKVENIIELDPITGVYINDKKTATLVQNSHLQNGFVLFPAKHYIVDPKKHNLAIEQIKRDLELRLLDFNKQKKSLEAYRLKQKVSYDLEMIQEFGFVAGIENYSRYFDGRQAGETPHTLLDHMKANAQKFGAKNYLTIIDESHITIPQIAGMHRGDQSRKQTLIEYGFRLPSALDNRPLTWNEFLRKTDQLIAVSATPGKWEIKHSTQIVEQIIRPTGLIDPEIQLRPSKNQIANLICEIILRKEKRERVIITTLTKKTAEDLTDYLNDHAKIKKLLHRYKNELLQTNDNIKLENILPKLKVGPIEKNWFNTNNKAINKILKKITISGLPNIKVAYLHSDIETLERSEILTQLRKGSYDVVVGINLLREGLDLPEVSLVAILETDKEGFLRSRSAIIQTIGRAARHIAGQAILYADKLTQSMLEVIQETYRRRKKQLHHNKINNIQPQSITKPVRDSLKTEVHQSELTKVKNCKKNKRSSIIINIDNNKKVPINQLVAEDFTPRERQKILKSMIATMKKEAQKWNFEEALEIKKIVEDWKKYE